MNTGLDSEKLFPNILQTTSVMILKISVKNPLAWIIVNS
jgi:hypothetical protein